MRGFLGGPWTGYEAALRERIGKLDDVLLFEPAIAMTSLSCLRQKINVLVMLDEL